MNRFLKFRFSLLLLLSVTVLTACNDDDQEVIEPVNENAEINDWISEIMTDYYLWTEEMPAAPSTNLEPEEFFKKLLVPQDRFSAIVPDYQELINSLNGVNLESGYEYALFYGQSLDPNVAKDLVYSAVLYTKANSPAANAGLKRGDVITHINGQQITESNFQSLLGALDESHTIKFIRHNSQTALWEAQPDVQLDAVELAENPNFYHDVITSSTGKKVGYIVYNFFSAGPNASTSSYDDETKAIFADFKSQGVEELILDLRYNSGGSIVSAVNLASLTGKGVDESKIFSVIRYNDLLQEYLEQERGAEFFNTRFTTLGENIGNNLSSSKIYVLTGRRTASASELIINGLKPYMDVHLIGDKTVGKNVGSIPIEDEENPNNNYGLLPIVSQVYNSAGQSDYLNGFTPQPNDVVNDLTFPMKELGDINEPLLRHALDNIDGITSRIYGLEGGRKQGEGVVVESPIATSLDDKARTNRLILDNLK